MKTPSIFVLVIAAYIARTSYLSAKENPIAVPVRGVSLKIAATQKWYVSGSAIRVRAYFINGGKIPLTFMQYPNSVAGTFLCQAIFGKADLRVRGTRFGREAPRRMLVPREWTPPQQIVPRGKLAEYSLPVPIARYVDMTLPGEYRVRVRTKYGFQSAGAENSWGGILTVGPHLSLIQEGSAITHNGRWPVGTKPVRSNWVKIIVGSPYRRLPKLVLTQPKRKQPIPQNVSAGIHIALEEPDSHGSGPVSIRAILIAAGRSAETVPLTGNPLADFGAIEVTGPSDLNKVSIAKNPKPHEVVSKIAVPAITAYGHWLATHPPNSLKSRTYILKAGVVYKYAEPINLSCQYDMSLSGVYRVRIRLAHTHIWSAWANVVVPPG